MPKSGTNRSSAAMVQTRRVRPERNYTDIPNDLIRGSGLYARLCPEERIILMGGLSCRDGYETTLDRIEGWLADANGRIPGRNRQEAFRRALREQGFLTTERGHVPAGRPDGGQIMWTYTFFQEPLSIEERDVLPAKKDRSGTIADAAEGADDADYETAGQTTPPIPGHGGHAGQEAGKTAGQTMPLGPGHGEPGHGEPGPGADCVYKEEKEQGLEELKTSSSLSSAAPADQPVQAREEDKIDEETPATAALLLAALFDRQHVSGTRRPSGTRLANLIALTAERLDAGWNPDQLRRALDEPLVGVDSVFAVMRHRLRELPVDPPQEPAQKARAKRCDKGAAHAPYPADTCVICAEEAQDAKVRAAIAEADKTDDENRPAAEAAPTKLTGVEAARAVAAAAGSGRKIELSRWAAKVSA